MAAAALSRATRTVIAAEAEVRLGCGEQAELKHLPPGDKHVEAYDRSRPRSMGRRVELERRSVRAAEPGLHRLPTNLLRGAPDWAYITSFLAQRTSGPVVLVGHSYGGFVITNAATEGGDVKALVYVDAFAPDEGETVFQILGGSGSAFDIPDPIPRRPIRPALVESRGAACRSTSVHDQQAPRTVAPLGYP